MSEGALEIDLEAVRADGWFDRVIAGVPALERLTASLGDALVALSLAAGFKIQNASVERTTGEVAQLTWVREDASGVETSGGGPPATLRSEVLAALIGEAESTDDPPEPGDDAEIVKAFIGNRYVMLAPLFGLSLRRLLLDPVGEPRIVAAHDGIDEVVTVKQLRRF
ncbi:MAG: hypothetical protein WCJ30_28765, partial [Deltaproteobacteria bacterium]